MPKISCTFETDVSWQSIDEWETLNQQKKKEVNFKTENWARIELYRTNWLISYENS